MIGGRQSLIPMLLATALVLAGCKSDAAAPPQKSIAIQPVQVTAVRYQPRADRWTAVGVLRARVESDHGFRVAGKLAARLVNIGDRVDAGQSIARLDPTDLALAVETQEAERRAALSVRDQAVAAESRFKSLLAGGHVSQAAVDQRIASADEARARVDRAERALAIARNQLAYADLRAATAGVVSLLPAEVGQVVAAGQPIARIAADGAVEAAVAVPEARLAAVRTARASAEVWGSSQRLPAVLRELAPESDRVTRTYAARFALEAPAGLALGQTVTIHLEPTDARLVARLPLSAVVNDGRGAAVWLVDGTGVKVTRQAVDVVAYAADHVLVGPGLDAGARVVSLGAHLLDEAKPVRIVEQRADAH
jgi:RND family efflux transporter MFP subunit